MKYSSSALVALLIVSGTAGDGIDRTGPSLDNGSRSAMQGARIPEPPNAPVQPGDRAPNFSWVGVDNQWHRLREVLDQAHVLLVFAPDDQALRQLESEREDLATMGVVTVAVLEDRGRTAAARVRRLGIHCLVVPDPVRVVGQQFNRVIGVTSRIQPAWFAIDRRGLVRGTGEGPLPPEGWARIAASSLAIPLPDAPLPARSR